ncbi:hypothetical protein HZC30_07085 [Candidatus Woesearchaeota archaeon]|nr:hypothetical protein [Candidatus Woesearchaeota archaeon]
MANSNWKRILYGKKTCKGMLTQEDFTKLRTEFRKNFSMRKIPRLK